LMILLFSSLMIGCYAEFIRKMVILREYKGQNEMNHRVQMKL